MKKKTKSPVKKNSEEAISNIVSILVKTLNQCKEASGTEKLAAIGWLLCNIGEYSEDGAFDKARNLYKKTLKEIKASSLAVGIVTAGLYVIDMTMLTNFKKADMRDKKA